MTIRPFTVGVGLPLNAPSVRHPGQRPRAIPDSVDLHDSGVGLKTVVNTALSPAGLPPSRLMDPALQHVSNRQVAVAPANAHRVRVP